MAQRRQKVSIFANFLTIEGHIATVADPLARSRDLNRLERGQRVQVLFGHSTSNLLGANGQRISVGLNHGIARIHNHHIVIRRSHDFFHEIEKVGIHLSVTLHPDRMFAFNAQASPFCIVGVRVRCVRGFAGMTKREMAWGDDQNEDPIG